MPKRGQTFTGPMDDPGLAGATEGGPAEIEVGQGSFALGDVPGTMLTATLGSCVAVCLHDPTRRQGGMNHIYQCVQPGPLGGGAIVAEVEGLVNALMRRGARRQGLRARVVGGAHMLSFGRNFGAQIADVCLAYLRTEEIPVLECATGGERARRAAFDPVAGRLELTYPGGPHSHPPRPPRNPAQGDWELF